MAKIIVVTDFSEAAQNALRYACDLFSGGNHKDLLLVNISEVPASYSGDGVAMAAISDTLAHKTDQLEDAVADVADRFTVGSIRYRALLGALLETLQELIEEEQASLVVMGTPAEYGEVWAWDTNVLAALTELPVPVLTVPMAAVYKPVRNICFASIPGNLHSASPIASLKKLVNYTGAQLQVVMVANPQKHVEEQEAGEQALREQLTELNARYHTIQESHVVAAIGKFVEEQHIDLLVVRPRKHGIWYNLFHKSYAKELARLNLIPVMALHDEWKVDE